MSGIRIKIYTKTMKEKSRSYIFREYKNTMLSIKIEIVALRLLRWRFYRLSSLAAFALFDVIYSQI